MGEQSRRCAEADLPQCIGDVGHQRGAEPDVSSQADRDIGVEGSAPGYVPREAEEADGEEHVDDAGHQVAQGGSRPSQEESQRGEGGDAGQRGCGGNDEKEQAGGAYGVAYGAGILDVHDFPPVERCPSLIAGAGCYLWAEPVRADARARRQARRFRWVSGQESRGGPPGGRDAEGMAGPLYSLWVGGDVLFH
ncbi:hypothetical protein D9M68_824090 [compost metagenome]